MHLANGALLCIRPLLPDAPVVSFFLFVWFRGRLPRFGFFGLSFWLFLGFCHWGIRRRRRSQRRLPKFKAILHSI